MTYHDKKLGKITVNEAIDIRTKKLAKVIETETSDEPMLMSVPLFDILRKMGEFEKECSA